MAVRRVVASHGWMWITQGFSFFRKAPAVWTVVTLILFAATKLFGLIWPVGVVFILLMPVFLVGLMEGCRALERGEPLQVGHLAVGFRKNAAHLVTVGGISLVGNLALMMIVLSLGGEAMTVLTKALSQGNAVPPPEAQAAASAVGRAMLVGTLVSLPFLMALWYAPLLVYFDDLAPLPAMKWSFVACIRNVLPFLVYGLCILAGMFAVMPLAMGLRQYDLALWLLAPVVLPSLYVSYKDIFDAGRAAK